MELHPAGGTSNSVQIRGHRGLAVTLVENSSHRWYRNRPRQRWSTGGAGPECSAGPLPRVITTGLGVSLLGIVYSQHNGSRNLTSSTPEDVSRGLLFLGSHPPIWLAKNTNNFHPATTTTWPINDEGIVSDADPLSALYLM